MLSWIVAPALIGAGVEKVPLRAASRLKGREEPREVNGGSIRVNGAEVRRLLLIPTDLRLGERPAGAVMGARAEDMLARIGVARRGGGAGID